MGSATNVNFFNLTFFNGFALGRTKTIARNIVVNSNLTISGAANSASVLMGTNNIDVNGNITLQDGAGAGVGAILTTTTGNINIAGNWSLGNNSSAFNAGVRAS